MTKLLTLVDVGQMHFNERNAYGCKRVAYGNAGMRVSSRIDDDVLRAIATGFLDAIDQSAFVIALEDGEFGTLRGGLLFESLIDVGQGKPAVDLGLACSEQVQIGAVQNQNALRHYENLVKTDRLFTPKSPVCPLSTRIRRV